MRNGTFVTDSQPAFATMRTTTSSAEWGDNDNDADFDLLDGGSKLLINSGTGNLTSTTLASYEGTRGLWGDYDLDGDLDILWCVGKYSTPGSVYFSRNDYGVFVTDITLFNGNGIPAFGDIDGDGDVDVFLVVYGNGGAFYRNTLAQDCNLTTCTVFAPAAPLANFTQATMLVAADIDGDKDQDLLVASTPPLIIENVGTTRVPPYDLLYFSGWQSIMLSKKFVVKQLASPMISELYPSKGYNMIDIVVGDIDGDGDIDGLASVDKVNLATVTNPGNAIYTLENSGKGFFASRKIWEWSYVRNLDHGLSDLNSEGFLDVVVPQMSVQSVPTTAPFTAGWIEKLRSIDRKSSADSELPVTSCDRGRRRRRRWRQRPRLFAPGQLCARQYHRVRSRERSRRSHIAIVLKQREQLHVLSGGSTTCLVRNASQTCRNEPRRKA
jgi:hypothetical protein